MDMLLDTNSMLSSSDFYINEVVQPRGTKQTGDPGCEPQKVSTHYKKAENVRSKALKVLSPTSTKLTTNTKQQHTVCQ